MRHLTVTSRSPALPWPHQETWYPKPLDHPRKTIWKCRCLPPTATPQSWVPPGWGQEALGCCKDKTHTGWWHNVSSSHTVAPQCSRSSASLPPYTHSVEVDHRLGWDTTPDLGICSVFRGMLGAGARAQVKPRASTWQELHVTQNRCGVTH
jgi:hypothetical protein